MTLQKGALRFEKNKLLPMSQSPPRKCPLCQNFSITRYRPFCSSRCQMVDLGNWLKGGYAIPGETASTDLTSDNLPDFLPSPEENE
jgi:endogenous inhibitor of DNA gyrase (YacG/DUF329 family)